MAKETVTLELLRQSIPKICFQKNLSFSLLYMLRDYLILILCVAAYPYLKENIISLVFYWLVTGFFMWCLFVVGHDCGHSSFSTLPLVNSICGHFCHAPLCVPYWPWAASHQLHHMYHNHRYKDNSHPWCATDDVVRATFGWFYWPMRLGFGPFLSFPFYLFTEFLDGNHFNPWSKLFGGDSTKQMKCVTSSVSVFLWIVFVFKFCNWSVSEFIMFYWGPYFVFSFWLFTVTFLQHHHENVIVYDDTNWTFLKGALQTMDRLFGFGIDSTHHHITSDHLVHHLFFTQIPHYNLPAATAAIRPVLEKGGIVYKKTPSTFFFVKIFTYLYERNFVA